MITDCLSIPKGMADACRLPEHPLVIRLNKITDVYMNENSDLL